MTPDEARTAFYAERERHNNTAFGDRKTQWESWERVSAALKAWHEITKAHYNKLLGKQS